MSREKCSHNSSSIVDITILARETFSKLEFLRAVAQISKYRWTPKKR